MNRVQAEKIIEEATQDKRLVVQLCTRAVFGKKQSYRVKLRLRKKDCNLIIKQPGDWPVVRDMWQGL